MTGRNTLLLSGAVLLLAAAAAAFYVVFFTMPRMRLQITIRTFEAAMPVAPADSYPLESSGPPEELIEPLRAVAPSRRNIQRGAVYYGYYCIFCHGPVGDGEGPVGQSFVPRPADLRRQALRDLSDRELLQAMLLGTGHEPVINRLVPSGHYPYLLLYVRSLRQQEETK